MCFGVVSDMIDGFVILEHFCSNITNIYFWPVSQKTRSRAHSCVWMTVKAFSHLQPRKELALVVGCSWTSDTFYNWVNTQRRLSRYKNASESGEMAEIICSMYPKYNPVHSYRTENKTQLSGRVVSMVMPVHMSGFLTGSSGVRGTQYQPSLIPVHLPPPVSSRGSTAGPWRLSPDSLCARLCVCRCHWKKAWIKQSSTSAGNWSTRPTTSTSPNPKPPAWRKDDRGTTEAPGPSAQTHRTQERALAASPTYCSVKNTLWETFMDKMTTTTNKTKQGALPCLRVGRTQPKLQEKDPVGFFACLLLKSQQWWWDSQLILCFQCL